MLEAWLDKNASTDKERGKYRGKYRVAFVSLFNAAKGKRYIIHNPAEVIPPLKHR